MRSILFSFILLITSKTYCQKVNFTLKGTLNSLSQKNKLYIFYNDLRRIDTMPFPIDGHLQFQSVLLKPGEIQIVADSSSIGSFWIDEGLIEFKAHENKTKYGIQFMITQLQGPEDTRLFYEMTRPKTGL